MLGRYKDIFIRENPRCLAHPIGRRLKWATVGRTRRTFARCGLHTFRNEKGRTVGPAFGANAAPIRLISRTSGDDDATSSGDATTAHFPSRLLGPRWP